VDHNVLNNTTSLLLKKENVLNFSSDMIKFGLSMRLK
jgi:hypothetical protein